MIHLVTLLAPIAVRIACPDCLGWGVTAHTVCTRCEGAGTLSSADQPPK